MTDERFEPAAAGDEPDPEAERLVTEIEVTRTEMGSTIDEIGHRLQPQTIVGQARDQLREATVGRVERVIDDAAQTAQQTSNTLMDTIRQNPVPAAMAAIGIGWLALRFREQPSYGYGRDGNGWRYGRTGYGAGYPASGSAYGQDPRSLYQPRGEDRLAGVRDTAERAVSGVQQAADDASFKAQRIGEDVQVAAQDAVQQAQYAARQAQWQLQGTVSQAQRQFDRALYENPLAVGAVAMGLGVVVALALPETQKERELMGEQRDRVLAQAGTVAQQALDQAERKAEEVGTQLRSES